MLSSHVSSLYGMDPGVAPSLWPGVVEPRYEVGPDGSAMCCDERLCRAGAGIGVGCLCTGSGVLGSRDVSVRPGRAAGAGTDGD